MNAAITIIRRPVKHARLRISEDGSVRLIAPDDFEPQQIEALLANKENWLRKNQEHFRNRDNLKPETAEDQTILHGRTVRVVWDPQAGENVAFDTSAGVLRIKASRREPGGLERALRIYARGCLRERLTALSEKHGLSFNRLFIRSQRTKWGNCSTLNNISLNWRLVRVPEYVCDYVLLHELLHTRIMNHGVRFWVGLKALCPDMEKASAWLAKHGASWAA